MTHDKPEVYIYFSSSVDTVDDSNKKGADCELKTVCSLLSESDWCPVVWWKSLIFQWSCNRICVKKNFSSNMHAYSFYLLVYEF